MGEKHSTSKYVNILSQAGIFAIQLTVIEGGFSMQNTRIKIQNDNFMERVCVIVFCVTVDYN